MSDQLGFALPVKLVGANKELTLFVQKQLVRLGYLQNEREIDGIVGDKTLAAFKHFKQDNYLAEVDTVGQTTLQKMQVATPAKSKFLNYNDFAKAANTLKVPLAAIRAVVAVETSGQGFFSDGRAKILYEAYWFNKFTNGAFNLRYPGISSSYWNPKLYLGGSREYSRLSLAESLNPFAARKATSWGLGQIMGFNYSHCGYDNLDKFIADAQESEGRQLQQMVSYILNQKLDRFLRERNWKSFAYYYNGEAYQKNKYDIHLAQAYNRFAVMV